MNALLEDWTGEFALPPFAEIRDADFAPAFEAALHAARRNVAAIAESAEAPTFGNTIAAMERVDRLLDRVAGVFFNLVSADSNSAREGLQRELAPKLAAYASEVTSNKALFARIEALWQGREALGLGPEEARVLELYRRSFVRAGAELSGEDSARMAEIMARLAELGTRFGQNVLAEERELAHGPCGGRPRRACRASWWMRRGRRARSAG